MYKYPYVYIYILGLFELASNCFFFVFVCLNSGVTFKWNDHFKWYFSIVEIHFLVESSEWKFSIVHTKTPTNVESGRVKRFIQNVRNVFLALNEPAECCNIQMSTPNSIHLLHTKGFQTKLPLPQLNSKNIHPNDSLLCVLFDSTVLNAIQMSCVFQ